MPLPRMYRSACLLLTAITLYAQDAAGPAAQLTMAVSTKTSEACGTATTLQPSLEGHLRSAGLIVSRVHNATVATEVDCTPATPPSADGSDASASTQSSTQAPVPVAAGMAVHQCLNLAQVVPGSAHANGMTLDTTWHQCYSYECAEGKCESSILVAQRGLADALIGYLREQREAEKLATADATSETARAESIRSAVTQATLYTTSTLVLKGRVAFYLLYILTCLAVLARWQYSRLTS